jgi:hypothetical protein
MGISRSAPKIIGGYRWAMNGLIRYWIVRRMGMVEEIRKAIAEYLKKEENKQ